MAGKMILTLLVLLIGTQAWAQPQDDFATAMLAADRKAPLVSVQKVTAICSELITSAALLDYIPDFDSN